MRRTIMKPKFTNLDYTYQKPDKGLGVLNFADIVVDQEAVGDRQVIVFKPGSSGGNHRHERTEWFVAFGDLVFYWLDEAGDRQEQHMNTEG